MGDPEQWRQPAGYDGIEVSDLGAVRTYWRGRGNNRRMVDHHEPCHVMVRDDGYRVITHRNRKVLVHRLVALAFIPNPGELPLVRHLNDTPGDDHAGNLAWGTVLDNSADAIKNGRMNKSAEWRVRSWSSKLTVESVKEIRRRRAAGDRCVDLAAEYGVLPRAISQLCLRQTWGCVE